MSCFDDVKDSIVDKIFTDMVSNRYTFTRVGDNIIKINGKQDTAKTRIKDRVQARQVAKTLSNKIEITYNGHARAFMIDEQGQPIKLKIIVNDAYVNYEVTQLQNRERDYVNNNTGPKTNEQLTLFSPVSRDLGVFAHYVEFKMKQVEGYKARINAIQKEIKNTKELSAKDLEKLKSEERKYKNIVEGNIALGIKGLEEEIEELVREADTKAVGTYVERDMERLDKLIQSTNIHDLYAARDLIGFYDLAGSFEQDMTRDGVSVENPFFSEAEMFVPDENGKPTTTYNISLETIAQYTAWRTQALGKKVKLDAKFKDLFVNEVNSNPSIVNTYKKEFTLDELTLKNKGLKDTDWFSMWTMDMTHGIFSTNGMLPQVIFSKLSDEFNKALVRVKNYSERMDKIRPDVIKRLEELNHTLASKGIVGIKGASFQLFKEITKDGNETTGLVQRIVKEYNDDLAKATEAFNKAKQESNSMDNPTSRNAAFNKAFENFKKWKRNNTIIMDISRMPEIAAEADFATLGAKADEAYKAELVKILGEKGYKEYVDKQIKMLRTYQSERQAIIEGLLIHSSKNTYAELSTEDKNKVEEWTVLNSPLKGIEDYNTVAGIYYGERKSNNYMKYNTLVPRMYKPNISIEGDNYKITDSAELTGHYSETFKEIEADPILNEFYNLAVEGLEDIRSAMPPELQNSMPAHTILSMAKTSSEIAMDKNTGPLRSLFAAFANLWDRLRTSFGVIRQSEVSYANIDILTGKPNYKINDAFLRQNTKEISQLQLIERTKFVQAYNVGKSGKDKLKNVERFTVLDLNKFNTESLVALAEYLHLDISVADIEARRIDDIKNRLTKTTDSKSNPIYIVDIGKYIRDFSIHTMVQSQSFDLPKILKYYHNLAEVYAAKQKALPSLELVKGFYQDIQNPKTNNLGTPIVSAKTGAVMSEGKRTKGNKQIEDWFDRVVLGNHGRKHTKELGVIYSSKEKERLSELQKLIEQETDDDTRAKLIKERDSLGRIRTFTAAIDNFLEWIKMLRLGYSLSSATTNFLEALSSNLILASSDQYFDAKELYYGYSIFKYSFIKNVSFGHIEHPLARKNRLFMDRHNVIVDSSNENQRSSHKTYSDRFSWMNPYALTQRTEFVNQSPLMVACLRTIKINDGKGNEASVWDASDNNGMLLPQFRTPDNVKNWEDLDGPEYMAYKQKLEKLILLGHGNYSELRGMMAKGTTTGKGIMMFKTWIPQQLYWRFAAEQDDIATGVQGFKGTYRSLTRGAGTLYGGTVGMALFGPLGAAAGAALGGLGARYINNIDTGTNVLQEMIESARLLFKKSLGFPINLVAGFTVGKQVIDVNKKQFFGKGDYFKHAKNTRFTEQDANNLRSNMSDIALQLIFIASILAIKGFFWDDDDKPDDPERIAHNILVNKLMQLSSQASSYVNPKETYENTVGSMAVLQYLGQLAKEVEKINNYTKGKDVVSSGINTGESGLANQTKKILMPGIFKDGNPAIDLLKGKVPMLGFETQAERQFTPSPYDDWFKNPETLDKATNRSDRAEERAKLLQEYNLEDYGGDEGALKKAVEKQVNEDLPTPAKLKKMGLTRKEYEELNK